MAINFPSSAALNVSYRHHHLGDHEHRKFCHFNGFVTQIFVVQTDYWVLIIAVCTFLILADHKKLSSWIEERRILLYCAPWVLPVIWASLGLAIVGYGSIGAWCWFASDEVQLLVNFVPRWLIIFGMLAMYARLFLLLWGAGKRFGSYGQTSKSTSGLVSGPGILDRGPQPGAHTRAPEGNNEATQRQARKANRKMKKLARLMLMYPLAYILIWTLPTAIRIYQATKGKSAPFVLETIDKSCIVIQGFIDAVIYGLTESSISSWRSLIWPKPFPSADAVDNTDHRISYHGKKHQPPLPPLQLGEEPANRGDSSSSVDVTVSRSDSTTRITAGSPFVLRERHGEHGFEFEELSPRSGTGVMAIRKTVDVTITTDVCPPIPARTSSCGPQSPSYSLEISTK
ncbi:hypothetical protein GE09DRAFT_461083 [Coniochaeta sp. 2T2.1]|nr:hypothetical protein GE09DRAFT_461083 [Coniochaeta sp. 2T2.1]